MGQPVPGEEIARHLKRIADALEWRNAAQGIGPNLSGPKPAPADKSWLKMERG